MDAGVVCLVGVVCTHSRGCSQFVAARQYRIVKLREYAQGRSEVLYRVLKVCYEASLID